MKKMYITPMAKKVMFSYQDQVTAASYPTAPNADPWEADKCTWGDGSCSVVFNPKAKGLDDCMVQG